MDGPNSDSDIFDLSLKKGPFVVAKCAVLSGILDWKVPNSRPTMVMIELELHKEGEVEVTTGGKYEKETGLETIPSTVTNKVRFDPDPGGVSAVIIVSFFH